MFLGNKVLFADPPFLTFGEEQLILDATFVGENLTSSSGFADPSVLPQGALGLSPSAYASSGLEITTMLSWNSDSLEYLSYRSNAQIGIDSDYLWNRFELTSLTGPAYSQTANRTDAGPARTGYWGGGTSRWLGFNLATILVGETYSLKVYRLYPRNISIMTAGSVNGTVGFSNSPYETNYGDMTPMVTDHNYRWRRLSDLNINRFDIGFSTDGQDGSNVATDASTTWEWMTIYGITDPTFQVHLYRRSGYIKITWNGGLYFTVNNTNLGFQDGHQYLVTVFDSLMM